MAQVLVQYPMLLNGVTPAPIRLVIFSSRARFVFLICNVTDWGIFVRWSLCRRWRRLMVRTVVVHCDRMVKTRRLVTGKWRALFSIARSRLIQMAFLRL